MQQAAWLYDIDTSGIKIYCCTNCSCVID